MSYLQRFPSSSDDKPMDHYVWGTVEKDTNHSACNTKARLVVKEIKEVFESLPRDTIKNACTKFWSQLDAVVKLKMVILRKLLHLNPNSS